MNLSTWLASARRHFTSDSPLLLAGLSLIVLGYVMVSSSSMHLGIKLAHDHSYYPLRQGIHILLGSAAALVIVNIKMAQWQARAGSLLLVGLLLLVVVLIPGVGIKVNGSTRWLSLAGLRIQVSEVAKLTSIVYMAHYVARHQRMLQQSLFGLLPPLLLFGFTAFLLLLEPDFGSAVVILTLVMGLLFLAGAPLMPFAVLAAGLVASAGALIWFEPYRMKRLLAFMDPWADPLNSGFQLVQALISFGRGEWLGVGLGAGIQKLFYLPEAHTDFLFSVVAEELGLVGVVAVIALFSIVFWRAFAIGEAALRVEQTFSAYVAYGIGIWFGFQAFVNMGVNMGLLPTKGLTLPLMSYGGGSMIVMCAALALLFRIQGEIDEINASRPKRKPGWNGVL